MTSGAAAALLARGAPRDQGIAQGQALGGVVRAWLRAQGRRRGALAWWDVRQASGRGPLTQLSRHLPALRERLEGIALGAERSAADLAPLWATTRITGLAWAGAGTLQATLVLDPAQRALARVRRSEPDIAGYASAELVLAPFPGCLAGVNERGVGVVVIEDRPSFEVSLRALAQDALTRASDLRSAVAHLILRARYAGGSGALLCAAAGELPQLVELERGLGRARPAEPRELPLPGAGSGARIDLRSGELHVDLGEGPLPAASAAPVDPPPGSASLPTQATHAAGALAPSQP